MPVKAHRAKEKKGKRKVKRRVPQLAPVAEKAAPPPESAAPQDRLVVADLRKIGILAGGIFVILLVLFLVWR